LRDKALLHFKQGARMISRDDLATFDGVLEGSRLEMLLCVGIRAQEEGDGRLVFFMQDPSI
jgi:hypothetical protein